MNSRPHLVSVLAAGISCLASPLFAATEATTDPVGFVTHTVAGGGSVASPRLSLISPTLTRPIEWQGVIKTITTTSTTTTITVQGNPWANNQFSGANGSYFVELAPASNPGAISDITATAAGTSPTTDSSITTSDNLTGFGAIGDTIKIRKHVTIADLFGANNSAGLLSSDEAGNADEVLIYDGAQPASYFYYKVSPTGSDPSDGWYDSGFLLGSGLAAQVAISPHQGVVIKRKVGGQVSFTSSGAVKTGNTLLPVVNGLNVLGTVSAKGITLGTSGLFTDNPATGLKSSDEAGTADELTIYTPTGQASYFYYKASPSTNTPGDGWYDSGFLLGDGVAANVAITPGSSFVLSRKGGPAFNWALPSPTSF